MASPTITMLDPQGIARAIPQEQASAAMQAGGTPVTKMIDPKGVARWVANDQVDAARQNGGVFANVSAAGVARPNVNMQTSALGQAVYGPPSGDDSLKAAGYAGPAPSQVSPIPSSAAMGLGVAGAGAMAAGQIPGVPTVARGVARATPWLAKRAAAGAAISQARRIPVVGKYIPSGAELAPFFYQGGGAAEAAKVAGTTAAAGEAEALASKALKPEATAMRPPETPAPYRFGPGQIPPESTAAPDPRVLAGNQGVITTPRGLLPAGEATEQPAAERVPVQNAPVTLSGESALRQVLGGLDQNDLLRVAKSRGISVTQEQQLRPAVAIPKLISKIVGDFKPDELDEVGMQYLENTRLGNPNLRNIGPENYRSVVLRSFFPDLKLSGARLNRMQQALDAARTQAGAR